MKSALRWVAVALLIGVAAHVVAIRAAPRVIMAFATQGAAQRGGWNRAYNPPLATAAARTIVRPSPDLAYTACAFDVAEKPLLIHAPLGDIGYASVSMFASNTDNFFVLNDRQAGATPIDLVLVGPRTPPFEADGRRVVQSPSDRGLVLFRRVVSDAAQGAAVERLRDATRCTPLDS